MGIKGDWCFQELAPTLRGTKVRPAISVEAALCSAEVPAWLDQGDPHTLCEDRNLKLLHCVLGERSKGRD